MKFTELSLPGLWLIEPAVYEDPRGYFMESYRESFFTEHIGSVHFVQDNESKSTYGVLRGLHAQSGQHAQAKLVRALMGTVLDVVVDMRRDSPTFGRYEAVELSDRNKRQLFVPRGFYHGFVVLSPEAIFSYKVDNVYNKASEVSLNHADPRLNIEWPVAAADRILSPKDLEAPGFDAAYVFDLPVYD